jgi:hypothetical protein
MPTTLTVTDNATVPTGVTAVIAGSSGAANTIFAQQVIGQTGSFSWTQVATQTGDGSLTIPLTKGYWFLYCLSAPATLSGIAYTQVTDGLTSVLDRSVQAIAATLTLLNLPSAVPGSVPSPSSNIIDVLNENDPKLGTPGIHLTTDKTIPTDEAALNGRDDLGHAIRVLVKDICTKFDNQRRSLYRGWWQSIFRAFHNQRLAGIPESIVNRVEMNKDVTPVSDEAPQVILDLTVRVITREVRGLGA